VRFRLFHPNAAAGLAAVATVCAVGAGTWPTPTGLLIAGDRVSAGRAPVVIETAGAGHAGPVVRLSFAGAQYVIPSDAVPYLGHGLDMSLFASDRARGSYGTGGMFVGGMRVSLAGARPAPAAARGRSRYTLTVHGIDAAGRPDHGDLIIVANVDDPKALGYGAISHFRSGVATFRVPAGTYWAVGGFNIGFASVGPAGPAAAGGAARMVVLPQFTVSAGKTITVDARKATSRVRLSTPRPATPQNEAIYVERISRGGQTLAISVQSFRSGLYINPVSRRPADGTLESSTAAQLFSPASAASPYQYNILIKNPPGTIPPQNFRVSAGALTTIHENFYASARTVGGIVAFGFLPSQPGSGLIAASQPALHVPGRDIMYFSTVGGSAEWYSRYWQCQPGFPAGAGQRGGLFRYRPGQVATEDWNVYPLHTAPNLNLLGAVPRGARIVSANRSGNRLTLAFMPFTDSVYRHLGTGYMPVENGTVSGTYQIRQNGTTIASGKAASFPQVIPGEFYHQVTLSPEPSVISFTLTARRTGAAYRLSSATQTTWTWRSAHESGATVPRYWYCSVAGNHNCAAQPLPMLRYAVHGLALNGTTAPGTQSLTVTVGHLQLAAAQKVTKVTVQVSVNGGKTWTSAAVTGSGGTYHARYTAPASSYVTLRVTATDAAGGRVSETITRAYATAS
jgi:hypothetical protein